MTFSYVPVAQIGHQRSTPQGVSSPAGGPRYRPSTARELPVDIATAAINGRPVEEPETQKTVEPAPGAFLSPI